MKAISMFLGTLILGSLAAAPVTAYPACEEVACFNPPAAYCDQPCWECNGEISGTEYNTQPGTCDNPTLITVGDIGCTCLQRCASAPALSGWLDLLAQPTTETVPPIPPL